MNEREIKITIFGDICPVKDTLIGFESGDPSSIISEDILRLISESDFTVGNLECALTDNPLPIKKTGPVLFAPQTTAITLAKAGFKALSLANNHIRDCGTEGLESTLSACNQNHIKTFGAGFCEDEAKKILIEKINGFSIGFMSFAEYEFNACDCIHPGAAILDIYTDFNRIREVRKLVDYLIVLYHGGIEYHSYPSPMLQKRCRAIANAGADMILCQHSHCIGTYEFFKNSFILYGQGNNLFGHRKGDDNWNEGLLIQLIINGKNKKIELIPCITSGDSVLKFTSPEPTEGILSKINKRAEEIKSDDFIKQRWIEFCEKTENLNIPLLLGWNRYLIYLNRKLKGLPLRWIYGRRKRNITHNLIRCEAHNEVINTILSNYDFE